MPVQRCKRYIFNRISLNLSTRMFCQILGGKRSFVAPPATYDLNSTYPLFTLYTDTTRIQRKSRKETKRGKEKEKTRKIRMAGVCVCLCVFVQLSVVSWPRWMARVT